MIVDARRAAPPRRAPSALLSGIDQALVTASALVIAVVVARSVSAAEFGGFALVLLVRIMLIELARAVAGLPAQLRAGSASHSDTDPGSGSDEASQSNETHNGAASLAVLVGAAIVVPGMCLAFLTGNARAFALVLAVLAPMIMLHDTLRHIFFAARDARGAVHLDAGVLGVQLLGSAAVLAMDRPAWWHFVAWGGGVVLASVWGVWRLAISIGAQPARAFVQQTRHLWPGLLADAGLVQAQRQLSAWIVLGFGSLGAVAGYRGSYTAFRPLGLATAAARVAILPELAEPNPASAERRTVMVAGRVSIALGLGAFLLTGLLMVLPTGVGEAVLGATWYSMTDYILPVGLTQAGQALGVGAQLLLTSDGRTSQLARTRLWTLLAHVAALVVGGSLFGAVGAAYGLAITTAGVLPIWWMTAMTSPGAKQD